MAEISKAEQAPFEWLRNFIEQVVYIMAELLS